MDDSRPTIAAGDRLAKVMARAGLCSRRDAEEWIKAGRVLVNGRKILTPAFNVAENDEVVVDGAPLAARQGTRVWLYHKPRGLVVTEKDPEGRPTVFETLAREGLPRVVSVGRLDINTEGLLLLTNDGGLKRVLELPATGWLRKYRVRAHGTVTQAQLDGLKAGATVDSVKYGPIEATLERDQGANVWLELALREGKNREVKNVLMALGLEVNRLIRVSYGPFQLGDLPVGGIEVVKARVLKDQLGKRLATEADVDFDSVMPERHETPRHAPASDANERQFGRGTHTVAIGQQRFRFTDRAEKTPAEMEELRRQRPRADRPGAGSGPRRTAPSRVRDEDTGPARQIHFDDGREPVAFEEKTYGKKPRPGDAKAPRSAPAGKAAGTSRFAGKPRPSNAGKGPHAFGDKPRRPRAEGDAARPARAFKPRGEGDAARPARSFSDKPRSARPAPGAGDGRPARNFGGKSRAAATDAAPRSFSDKPRRPRADGDAARPARAFKPRSAAGATGAEARIARKPSGKPEAGAKPFRPRNGAAKPTGDRPRSARPAGSKPAGSRPPRGDGPPRRPPSRPRQK